MTPTFLYGIVPASYDPPGSLTGLGDPGDRGGGGEPVRVVREGEIGALVSTLPPDVTPGTRADLEAHARVLAHVVEPGGTIVPARFGMVFDGEDAVRAQLLKPRAAELRGLLDALTGRVQLTLKAIYDEGLLLREIVAGDREIRRLSEATRDRPGEEVHAEKVRLGELVAQAVDRRRAADQRALLDRLVPLTDEVLVEEPKHERMALHAQLLVAADRRERVDDEVQRLAAEQEGRMRFRYVGPLAPWSFADVELEPEAAWA